VLLVAEHGDYPFNQKQQQLYPRFQFFRQIVWTFSEAPSAPFPCTVTSISRGAGTKRSRCMTGRGSCNFR
jgi:hypothetical protein